MKSLLHLSIVNSYIRNSEIKYSKRITKPLLRRKAFVALVSRIETKKIDEALKDESWVEDIMEKIDHFE